MLVVDVSGGRYLLAGRPLLVKDGLGRVTIEADVPLANIAVVGAVGIVRPLLAPRYRVEEAATPLIDKGFLRWGVID